MNTNRTKNSVVCTIAAKLAKKGVKNPMRVAWIIHRTILAMLDAIRNKTTYVYFSYAVDLEYMLMSSGILPSQVLPASVLNIFAKTGLKLA